MFQQPLPVTAAGPPQAVQPSILILAAGPPAVFQQPPRIVAAGPLQAVQQSQSASNAPQPGNQPQLLDAGQPETVQPLQPNVTGLQLGVRQQLIHEG